MSRPESSRQLRQPLEDDQAPRARDLEAENRRLRERLAALEAERDRLDFILDSIPEYVAYVDANLVYRFCNRIYETETGRPRADFIGKHVVEFMSEQGLAQIRPHLDQVLRGEAVTYQSRVDYRFLAQQDVEVRYTPRRARTGEVIGFSVYVRNITKQRRAEETLRRQAQHDPLTDLPNRMLFDKHLAQAIGRAKRSSGRLALLFIDLDGFKQVNDRRGHEVGDQVLREVAETLRRILRRDDTLARFGGDEFVLLAENIEDAAQAEKLADKVIDRVGRLESPALGDLRIGASVGIAFYPDHAGDAREILARADAAMYIAKRRGKRGYHLHGETGGD